MLPVLGPRLRVRRSLSALVGVFALTTPCLADDEPPLLGKGFTLYAGYQFGGNFTDEKNGQTIGVLEGRAFSASLDIPLDESSEFQIFYNHQSTEFTPWLYPEFSDKLRLDYLHIGGTYFPEEFNRGVYVVGGVGATRMTPDAAGLNPATKLSMNLGIGYLLPLSKNVAVRFEARGLATLINSNTSVFCSGGCVVSLSGSGVTQGEFLIGLSARFK